MNTNSPEYTESLIKQQLFERANKRTETLMWWNSLNKATKKDLFFLYKAEKFTPARNEGELTGREIELIRVIHDRTLPVLKK